MKDEAGGWKKSRRDGSGPVANQPRPVGGAHPDGPIVQRITNDAREDEMEENMQAVGSILGNLKSMAQDMGSEIETQNKQIDRIGAKVNNNDDYRYIYQLSLIIIILLTLQSVHIDK